MRILTTHNKKNHPEWLRHVEMLPGWQADVDRNFLTLRASSRKRLVRDLTWAWRFFRASANYDVLLTGSERFALIVALLQRLLRRRHRVPHVLLECMWMLPQGRIARWKRRILLGWVAEATDRIVVYARHQIDGYSSELDIPKQKFTFVHSHSTLYGAVYDTLVGDYIFSGGYTNRDYRTFLEAVRGLRCRVIICVRSKRALGPTLPLNVEVLENVTEAEFNRLMAASAFVVVPLTGGVLEAGGRQVFQNAMVMGKAVIVTDLRATDYITDGMTGLLVPPENAPELRRAILSLLDNPARALALGQEAQKLSSRFAPERFFERVLAVTANTLSLSSSAPRIRGALPAAGSPPGQEP